MGLPRKPLSLLFLALSLFTISGFSVSVNPSSDQTKLVYKGCGQQKFQEPSEVYSQTLQTLLDSLVSQSSSNSFSSKTSGGGQSAIFGLYQCRGDLATTDCYNCVSKIPNIAEKLCKKAVAARIQLNGCYLRYEIAGFKQISGTDFIYRVCGSSQASGADFEEKRDSAFDMVEKGVVGGFYTGSYESIYVLGQCEGDLSGGDCGDCVKIALERVKAECGNSLSGQVYLHKCYISYNYYTQGVPSKSSSDTDTETDRDGGQGTKKTVAIVVGGVAALGFGIACLMFVSSAFKKRDKKYGG